MVDKSPSKTTLCVHGHFYQPPREDPLTGEIPQEKGADPFHDWNEKIFAECYLPNLEEGNFSRISFNIGPTLFTWMEQVYPEAVSMIIAADRANVAKYGVGNAIAQPYNHTILPLATREDKITQISWGIDDFQHRFGRKPQGMWLPEAAVDLQTMKIMADHGIEFTILAPWQAAEDSMNPTVPYHVKVAGGKSMTVFFYEAELSMLVSFQPDATTNANAFVENHLRRVDAKWPMDGNRIITLASDGELYGHHQPMREKFLAYLLAHAAQDAGCEVKYPALWLKENKVDSVMEILQNTSWSCHHGVSRWDGTCDCTPNAGWKHIFRTVFNELSNDLDDIYNEQAGKMVADPMHAKTAYLSVMKDEYSWNEFLSRELIPNLTLTDEQKLRLHYLFESQWERQRMYTSCAWFFEDFDRIEPQNNVAYLAQAIWLTLQASGIDLSTKAERLLSDVKSNRVKLSADQVFIKHWKRANAYGFKKKQKPPYIH
jgi:alpha-amylase/alpha-mannosidase (GH57 family)